MTLDDDIDALQWNNDCMTKTYVCSSDYVFETYEEAELACLKKLIEIVESKNEQK